MPVGPIEATLALLLNQASGSKAVSQGYEPRWVPNPTHSDYSPLNSYSRRVTGVYAEPVFLEDAQREMICGPLRQLRWAEMIGMIRIDKSSMCPGALIVTDANYATFAKVFNSGKGTSDAIRASGKPSLKLDPVRLLQEPKTRKWIPVQRTIAEAARIQRQLEDAAVSFVENPGDRKDVLENVLNYWINRYRLKNDPSKRNVAIGLFLRSKGVAVGRISKVIANSVKEEPIQAVSVQAEEEPDSGRAWATMKVKRARAIVAAKAAKHRLIAIAFGGVVVVSAAVALTRK